MKRFLVACLAVGLTGCSWIYGSNGIIHDRADEYLKAQTELRMKIPEGVPTNTREQDYLSIPALPKDANTALPEEFEIPKAPPLLADQKEVNSSDDVSLNEMKSTQVDQVTVADKYNAQLINDENQNMVLKLTGHFNEVWDDVGETLKLTETEVVDLNRTTGIFYIKSEKITMQLKIKETNGVVIVSVEDDKAAISDETRQTMLKKIKEKLAKLS